MRIGTRFALVRVYPQRVVECERQRRYCLPVLEDMYEAYVAIDEIAMIRPKQETPLFTGSGGTRVHGIWCANRGSTDSWSELVSSSLIVRLVMATLVLKHGVRTSLCDEQAEQALCIDEKSYDRLMMIGQ